MKDVRAVAKEMEQRYSTKQRDELRSKHPEIADGVEKAQEVFGPVTSVKVSTKEKTMIQEEEVNKALEWLVSNADKAAEARATRQYLDDFSRTIKAEIMSEHMTEAVNAQERFAYIDQRYKTHLEGLRVAIKEDEKFRWLKDTAIAKIDVYRTQQANLRGVK